MKKRLRKKKFIKTLKEMSDEERESFATLIFCKAYLDREKKLQNYTQNGKTN